MKSFTEISTVLIDAGSSAKISRPVALNEKFDRILAVNGAALKRLAASYTNTISDRDDLFQEIVIAVWRAMPQFRQECSERTFVFGLPTIGASPI